MSENGNIPPTLVKRWSLNKEKSPPASSANPPPKRPKACFHCRQSKVKCNNNNGDYSSPCKRCLKHNLECYYEYKVSNYKNVNESSVPPTSLVPTGKRKLVVDQDTENGKRSKTLSTTALVQKTLPSVLSDLVTLEECNAAFEFFNTNLLPQLFGLSLLRNVDVLHLRQKNSLLAIVVLYLSSCHDLKLNKYNSQLKVLFDLLVMRFVILKNDPPLNDLEAYHLVLALALGGFWLNQNFTGMAIQLAKNSGLKLNKPQSPVPAEDRLRLWYMLYLLDGEQALAYNREPMIMNQDFVIDGNLKRRLAKRSQGDQQPSNSNLLQDIRLVSQVEYNSITNEIFKGHSWDLLDPSRFGIPFKTNLELDKWMVHWTVLLGSITGFDKNVWSSKSTLIYYNFAKMHVNSKFIRSRIGGNDTFLHWSNDDNDDSRFHQISEEERGTDLEMDIESDDSGSDSSSDSDSDSDQDSETNASSKSALGKISKVQSSQIEQNSQVSSKIATESALNILQLILFDPDILQSLHYCPTHIHVLLYYAVLLALNSPTLLIRGYSSFFKLIKLLKNLLKLLSINLPVDKNFGLRMIFHLKQIMIEKMQSVLEMPGLLEDVKNKLLTELDILRKNSHIERNYEDLRDDDDDYDDEEGEDDHMYWGNDTTNGKKKISAWPGTDHSHPIVDNTKIIDFSS